MRKCRSCRSSEAGDEGPLVACRPVFLDINLGHLTAGHGGIGGCVLGHAKVGHLGLVAGIQEDVVAGQVSMEDAIPVQVSHC